MPSRLPRSEQRAAPVAPPPSCAAWQSPRNLLLQHLQGLRSIPAPRLTDQQVHMFRHDYKSHQQKSVAHAYLIEYSDENIARVTRPQKGPSPIATEGDEMQVTASVIPTQRVAHHRRKPAPLNTTRVRHPTSLPTKNRARMIHSLPGTRKDNAQIHCATRPLPL